MVCRVINVAHVSRLCCGLPQAGGSNAAQHPQLASVAGRRTATGSLAHSRCRGTHVDAALPAGNLHCSAGCVQPTSNHCRCALLAGLGWLDGRQHQGCRNGHSQQGCTGIQVQQRLGCRCRQLKVASTREQRFPGDLMVPQVGQRWAGQRGGVHGDLAAAWGRQRVAQSCTGDGRGKRGAR